MTRRKISTGSPFEKNAGYSRAIVQGDWCFVAGTTGYDYATMTMPRKVEDQTRNAMKTIQDTLEQAGFSMNDIVRAHYFITEQSDAGRVMPILAEILADIAPAATMVVAQMIKPEMLIEIEVTALRSA